QRDLIQQQILERQPPPRGGERLTAGGKVSAAQREVALAQVVAPANGFRQVLGPARVASLQCRLDRRAQRLRRYARYLPVDGNQRRFALDGRTDELQRAAHPL